jgi:protein SCO1/2
MSSRTSKVLITLAWIVLLGTVIFVPGADAQTRTGSRAKSIKRTRALQPGEYFTCLMHPEVKQAKAGHCPKCGMDLRLTRADPPAAAADNTEPAAAIPAGEKMIIPDVELLDQDGRKIHFYSDLIRGRVVVINFIFTTCTTICPPLGATFARVQTELGERAGRDVSFISISVDPVTDTPERLKAWGAKFHAGPAWTFVTGPRPLINELLRALGAATASPQDHSPTVLIGNDARDQWTRTYGLARPSQLVQLIDEAIAGRLGTATQEVIKQ